MIKLKGFELLLTCGYIAIVIGVLFILLSFLSSVCFFWGTLISAIGLILLSRYFVKNNIAFWIVFVVIIFLFVSLHAFTVKQTNSISSVEEVSHIR